MSLSADPNPFPTCNVVSTLDHVRYLLLLSTDLAGGGATLLIAGANEHTCSGAWNPIESKRDVAASFEGAFFIVLVYVITEMLCNKTILIEAL